MKKLENKCIVVDPDGGAFLGGESGVVHQAGMLHQRIVSDQTEDMGMTYHGNLPPLAGDNGKNVSPHPRTVPRRRGTFDHHPLRTNIARSAFRLGSSSILWPA
jgi:hypothetical protein